MGVNDPAMAFARYEETRRDRTAAVVSKSHENRKLIFSPTLAQEGGVATAVTPWLGVTSYKNTSTMRAIDLARLDTLIKSQDDLPELVLQ